MRAVPNVPGGRSSRARRRLPRDTPSRLGDAHVRDRLAVTQRDLAKAAREVAEEVEGDRFDDSERSVRLDADLDVGLRKRERLGRGGRSGGEQDGERRGCGGNRAGEPQNCTCTGSRAGSSISKYGRRPEAEDPGDHVRRHGLDRVHVRQHRVVVDLARHRDRLLDVGKLRLEVEEVLARPQLGVGLADGDQPPERRGQDVLRPRLLLDPACGLRRGAGDGDRLERLALVRRVALDGLDEVRNQVVSPSELDVDLGPRVLGAIAQPDEAVVEKNEGDDDEDDDPDHDVQPDHVPQGIGAPGRSLHPSDAHCRCVAVARRVIGPAEPGRARTAGRPGDDFVDRRLYVSKNSSFFAFRRRQNMSAPRAAPTRR